MARNESGPDELEVKLDGATVVLPAERRTLDGIVAYLDSLALRRQRILCWLCVDGEPVNLTHGGRRLASFSQVEAESMGPAEVPHQLIKGALQQTIAIRAKVQSAVELALINNCTRARDLWWSLSVSLKEPLLTLSLLPDTICGPDNGRASMAQLRKWQLQQLGGVIQAVDTACASDESIQVADALETRVLPWLDKLQDSLQMWSETFSVPAALPAATEAA